MTTQPGLKVFGPDAEFDRVMDAFAPRPTFTVRRLVLAGGLLGVLLLVLVLVRPFSSDGSDSGPRVSGPADAPFEMRLARGWKPLPGKALAQLPGAPLSVVRSADGSGTIVVARNPRNDLSPAQLSSGLKRRLKGRFADLREVSSKVVTLPAGRAFIYSFARTKTGIAQTLVIVSAGSSTYAINAVVRPGTPATARQVGAMLGTFDVPGR